MKSAIKTAPSGDKERLRAIELLRRYDMLDDNELSELKSWFAKRASALDVGMIASENDIRRSYEEFRKRHLDRFTIKDAVAALAIVLVVTMLVVMAYQPS